MRKCPYCEEWNNEDEIQCRKCHEWLDVIQSDEQKKIENDDALKNTENNDAPKKTVTNDAPIQRKALWKPYSILIILIVLILMIFIFYLISKDDPAEIDRDAQGVGAPLHEESASEPKDAYPVDTGLSPAQELIKKAKDLCSADGACPEEAIHDLTEAIRFEPDNSAAYIMRGKAYYKTGQDALAVGDLTNAIRLAPENHHAYALRGAAYGDMAQYDLAVQDYDKAILLNPGTASYYKGRGDIHLFSNKITEACQSFKKACEYGACDALQKQRQRGNCQ